MTAPQNDFSQGSVPRSIMKLALPMTAAQLVNVLYSVVDRVYLGRLPDSDSLALTGLGITMPIVSILMGLANLCGTGGAPLCSMSRGRGDDGEAERVMGNAFLLLLILGGAATAFFLALKGPILYLFGASPDTFPHADGYLTIYLLGTLFVMISLGMNPFINAQGFGRTGMMTVLLGAAVNLILDPVLIFVFHMGVRGAALATVISQALSAAWVLAFLTGKRAILRLRRENLRLEAGRTRRIVSLGLSGFFVNLTTSLVQVVCNATLQRCGGDTYVGVMTIINSIREVFIMPVHGLTNGSQPVAGYNYGAKQYSRVRQSIRFSVGVTVAYSAAFWVCAMLVPGALIRVFKSDPEILAAGVPALRIYFSMFLFMSLQLAGQGVFVGLGRSKQAVFFSLLRKAIVNAPLTVLLALWMGADGVFTAEAVSQLVGGLACFTTMYLTVYRPLGRLADGEAGP
ncbi:MAG: MATE family efflux transporter [Oscillospiraceae bacterium]|nr:MATE family efflux transporter [Oscillospiraceae bacterium]